MSFIKKKSLYKRLISSLLTLCLILALAACGDGEAGGEWHTEEKTIALPEEMAYASAMCVIGGRIYAGGPGAESAMLAFVESDGSYQLIDLPEDYEYIYTICAADQGIALLIGDYPGTYYGANGALVETGEPGEVSILVLDENGETASKTPLAEKGADYSFMLHSDDGFILMNRNSILKLGADGEERARIDAGEYEFFFSMVSHDSEILISVVNSNANRSSICAINIGEFSLRTLAELSGRFVTGLGTSADGALLICDENEVSSLSLSSGECVTEFTFTDAGVTDSRMTVTVAAVNDGLLLFSPHQSEISLAVSVYEAKGGRVTLTLVTDSLDVELKELVNDFNKAKNGYRIKIKVLEGNYTEDRLRTEIIAGKSPDIFAFYFNQTLGNLENSRLYEDLLPYLDADPDYGREIFVPSLFNTMSSSGHLRQLPCDFSISTFIAPSSLIPEPGITFEELKKVMKEQEQFEYAFIPWMTKVALWQWCVSFSIGNYIDKDSGTCSFDSVAFVNLLKMCDEMTAYEDVSNLPGEILYAPSLMSAMVISRAGSIARAIVYQDQNYCYAGFPNEGGNGSEIRLHLRMSISTQSEHKRGAWEFLRSALSEENQEKMQFMPARLSVLEKQVEERLSEATKDSGRAFSQKDADKFWEMLNGISVIAGGDPILREIMLDEAAVYFAGGCTAEEAAAQIQSRASLYVSEQFG